MKRKMKLVKDGMKPAIDMAAAIMQQFGIVVTDIKKNGENFEFTFDRDLSKEPAAAVNALKSLMREQFPNYDLVDVEE